MNNSRSYAWSLLALAILGMFGLSAWNMMELRRATRLAHASWVERVSSRVVADREDALEVIEKLPALATANPLARLTDGRTPIAAIFITDDKYHRTERWIDPREAGVIRAADPRLVSATLRVLESRKTMVGPVLALSGRLYWTFVRPIDRSRAMAVYVPAV